MLRAEQKVAYDQQCLTVSQDFHRACGSDSIAHIYSYQQYNNFRSSLSSSFIDLELANGAIYTMGQTEICYDM